MSKHALTFVSSVTFLFLIGCATSDNRDAAIGQAVVNTVTVVAVELAVKNCEETNSGTAREACLSKMRDSQSARNVPLNPAPKPKFEDLETYNAKRDAELATSE